jgi:methanogenic corrinoid protein MtbC1
MFGASPQSTAHAPRRHRPDPGAIPPSDAEPSRSGRPERLARLERAIPHAPVPHLMTSFRSGPHVVPPAVPGRPIHDADVAAFVRAVRSFDEQAGAQLVQALLQEGASVEAVYLQLVSPAARTLGTMWEDDECDFVEVTVALGRMQRLLRDLSQLFLADAGHGSPVGSILLSCIPGEQHTLGIIMVGEFLLRDGWRVLVGAPWSEQDLHAMVGSEWYDIIGFSVGSAQRLSTLKRDIRRLRSASRNPQLQVMVGGQVFADDPSLLAFVGADAIADSAKDAPLVARSLLAAARAVAPEARAESGGGRDHRSDAARRP